MSELELQRKVNLLESTLREILRLKDEADKDPGAVSFEDVFDAGRSDKEWRRILRRAATLV